MATAMATAAAHTKLPFALPAIPRVRPPPIPRGTPGPNTLPVPPGTPPRNRVWADGKWRFPESNSVKHKRKVLSRQLEKAVQHEIHGMHIYAYKHNISGRVVYSLTNALDENNVLKQILFHGKKTVPSTVRRDQWRLYFSVHFPQTSWGAAQGLRVYQELRELSLRRQLSPPAYLTHGSQPRKMTAVEQSDDGNASEATKEEFVKIVGTPLSKAKKAKVLMNHGASSVADLAAVLQRHTLKKLVAPIQEEMVPENEPTLKDGQFSLRALRRLRRIKLEENEKAVEIQRRAAILTHPHPQTPVIPQTIKRLELENPSIEWPNAERAADESQAYQNFERARALAEQEKKKAVTMVEEDMRKAVEAKLALLPTSDREAIRQQAGASKTALKRDLDQQLATAEAQFQTERALLESTFSDPPTKRQQRQSRQMQQKQARQIALQRAEHERRLRYVGPFEEIYSAILKIEHEKDQEWHREVARLREATVEEWQNDRNERPPNVVVRWADVRDGLHAIQWPRSVDHQSLEQKAVSGRSSTVNSLGAEVPSTETPPQDVHLSTQDEGADQRRAKRVEQEIQRLNLRPWNKIVASDLEPRLRRIEAIEQNLDVKATEQPDFQQAVQAVTNCRKAFTEAVRDRNSPSYDSMCENLEWLEDNREGVEAALRFAYDSQHLQPELPREAIERLRWLDSHIEIIQLQLTNIELARAAFRITGDPTHETERRRDTELLMMDEPVLLETSTPDASDTPEPAPQPAPQTKGIVEKIRGVFRR